MHEQAFHTCCRRGLTQQPGFQFNAVSPGLSAGALDRLASAHAGYHPPRNVPPEPTGEQLEQFPLSLRHRAVDGVGQVISQTVYVGREFRGRGGEPDSGRFGNYFSHVVVGDGAEDPFDGLLPIELWKAEHWSTEESPDPAIEPIGTLRPGPLDLDTTLSTLLSDRTPWLAEVVSATVGALYGGPRVVLIDEPGTRAAAWVALVSFSLPRPLADRLSFSTFEGRPRYADLQLVLCTPGCDAAFPAYELGSKVIVIDTLNGRPDPGRQTLLGRVIASLAQTSGEALCGVARALQAADCQEPASLAGAFAILSGRVDLAEAHNETAAILRLIGEWHRAGRGGGSLTAAARALAAREGSDSEEALAGWEVLHGIARQGGHDDSAELVDIALAQLIGELERVPANGAVVSCEAPVRPAIATLAGFVDGLVEAVEPDDVARRLAVGWRLGLVGLNDELDRRFAATLVDHLRSDAVRRTFAALVDSTPHRGLASATLAALMERAANDSGALASLVELSGQASVEEAMNNAIRASDSFDVWLVGAHVQLTSHPQRRGAFVARLAELAVDERDTDALRRLYGPSGPTEASEHAELVEAYRAATRRAPAHDLAAAWRTVLAVPFEDPGSEQLAPLVQALADAEPQAEQRAPCLAWRAVQQLQRRSGELALRDWTDRLALIARRPSEELPPERHTELARLTASLVLRCGEHDEHRACFEDAASILGRKAWMQACGAELAHGSLGDARTLARFFETWASAGREHDSSRRLAIDELLPAAVATWSPRRRAAVARALPSRWRRAWASWEEQHPPARTVVRAVGRLRRGGEERR